MKFILVTLLACHLCLFKNFAETVDTEDESSDPSTLSSVLTENNFDKLPTILIVTLFRNKAHTLPYFFTFLNRLDYPKERIAFW